MLNPYPITEAIAAALAAIPDLAAAMTVLDANGEPVCRIFPFHYLLGQENRLARAIYEMPGPSMMVVWDGTQPGNGDGQTLFKHRFNVYFRMGNSAGSNDPVGYEKLWWLTCDGVPHGSTTNIRYMNIHAGLEIMDSPGVAHAVDEDQIDRFVGTFLIPEIGDQ